MASIGLAMIVKNGAEDLRCCLESVRGLTQQIVVADTGSTDGSPAIAREFGAEIISVPWEQHYAKARNAALERMTTDWALVLDADEELAEEARQKIPALLDCDATVGGLQVWQRNYLKERFLYANGKLSRRHEGGHPRASGALSYLDNPICRIFRAHPLVRFSGRIHELVEPQLSALKLQLVDTDLVVHHFGKLCRWDAELEKQKTYRDLLRASLEETPGHARQWVQLGLTEKDYFGNSEEALRCYERAVQFRPTVADAWIGLSRLLRERREFGRAMEAIAHLPQTGEQGILRQEMVADLLHDMGRLKEACAAYRVVAQQSQKSSMYRAMGKSASLESKLGYVEVRLGMQRAGLRKLRTAVQQMPDVLELHDRLVKALVWLHQDGEAADAAETILEHFVSENIFARAVALRLRTGQKGRAEQLRTRGLQCFPESEALRRLHISVAEKLSGATESRSCLVS